MRLFDLLLISLLIVPVSTICQDADRCGDCIGTQGEMCAWMACCSSSDPKTGGLMMTISMETCEGSLCKSTKACEECLPGESRCAEINELFGCWGGCHKITTAPDMDSPDEILCASQSDCRSCTETITSNGQCCMWFSQSNGFVTKEVSTWEHRFGRLAPSIASANKWALVLPNTSFVVALSV